MLSVSLFVRVLMPFVANGVSAPIRMMSFPSVETFHAIRFHSPPNTSGPQINVFTVDDPHIFNTIPSIVFRHDFHHRRRVNHGGLGVPFVTIFMNGATQEKVQGSD
jgi:hypothetical protein